MKDRRMWRDRRGEERERERKYYCLLNFSSLYSLQCTRKEIKTKYTTENEEIEEENKKEREKGDRYILNHY